MPALLGIMLSLQEVFKQHAGAETKTMTKANLSELLRKEFGGPCGDQKAVDELFKGLDANGDDVVDFTEFVTFVSAMTVQCMD